MAKRTDKKDILDLLAKGPVIGDGSYVWTLERRGFVRAGVYTPEAVLESPNAVKQLHREFLNAGSDLIQAFTFYSAAGKLKSVHQLRQYTSKELNEAACNIAKEVAQEYPGTLICGGVSPTPTFKTGDVEKVKEEFRTQCKTLVRNEVDFMLGEFFGEIAEAELAISVMKEFNVPVACTMRLGPTGDLNDIECGQCAIRMAKAGADILGLNCQYDPDTCIDVIKVMKAALDAENLHPYLMLQPLGFHCPEAKNLKRGYHDLPEFPHALEPRLLTRCDVRKYVMKARDAGVRYFGGCCGFEPYHIREITEELKDERKKGYPGESKNGSWNAMEASSWDFDPRITTKEHWFNLIPSSGRPGASNTSVPTSEY